MDDLCIRPLQKAQVPSHSVKNVEAKTTNRSNKITHCVVTKNSSVKHEFTRKKAVAFWFNSETFALLLPSYLTKLSEHFGVLLCDIIAFGKRYYDVLLWSLDAGIYFIWFSYLSFLFLTGYTLFCAWCFIMNDTTFTTKDTRAYLPVCDITACAFSFNSTRRFFQSSAGIKRHPYEHHSVCIMYRLTVHDGFLIAYHFLLFFRT